MRGLFWLLLILVLPFVAGLIYQHIGALRDRRRFLGHGTLIDAGDGRHIYVSSMGSGSPAVIFESGHNLNYYVNRAGGYSVDAAKGEILVLRYGGLVIKATNHTEIQVGDIVWVPSKVMSANLESQKDIIDTVTKEITTGVLLIAVLKAFGL